MQPIVMPSAISPCIRVSVLLYVLPFLFVRAKANDFFSSKSLCSSFLSCGEGKCLLNVYLANRAVGTPSSVGVGTEW